MATAPSLVPSERSIMKLTGHRSTVDGTPLHQKGKFVPGQRRSESAALRLIPLGIVVVVPPNPPHIVLFSVDYCVGKGG